MTIVEQISRAAEELSPRQRRKALKFVEQLRGKSKAKAKAKRGAARGAGKALKPGELHPALRAIAGMWKDRTDLPKDGAAASKVLRRRLMRRLPHA